MRVQCESCKSAYAVDDKLISPKGVRAQCPRCKHLQVVRPGADAAPTAAEPAAQRSPPPRPATATVAAPRPPAPPPPPPGDPFAWAEAPGAAKPARPATANCRVCGKVLTDTFDIALGVCESCSAKAAPNVSPTSARPAVTQPRTATPPPSKPSAPPPPPPAARAVPPPPPPAAKGNLEALASELFSAAPVETPKAEEPLSLELDTKPAAKPQPAPAEAGKVERKESAPGRKVPDLRKGLVMTRERDTGAIVRRVVMALVGLGLVGGGGWAYVTRPAFVAGVLKPKEPQAPPVAPAIEKRLAGWKMTLPELSGTSAEHVVAGRKLFLEDKPASYRAAEEEFKAAIVLDPQNLGAVAGYVEAFSVGRGEGATPDEIDEMRELVALVLTERPKLSTGYRAKANLLLATNEVDLARTLADKAVQVATGPDEKGEALVALGRTYLHTSAPVAREKFDAALQKDPTLKRALYYRGLAAEYAGHFAQALADYEERLKLDPDQREALAATARVQAGLGDFQSARKALAAFAAKYPDVGEPRVSIVQIAYAVERDLREADRSLKRVNVDYDKFDDRDKRQLTTLWSAIARERGELTIAEAQANTALKIDPKWAPAQFQRMLLALALKKPDDATAALEACASRLGPGQADSYRGRIALVAGKYDEAIAAFRKAEEGMPTRIGPYLGLAAAQVKKGDSDGALRTMKKAMAVDTASTAHQKRPVSDFYEPPTDAVKIAAGVFESMKGDNLWLPQTYGAVVTYHLGDLDKAQAAFEETLKHDDTSLPALLYLAQISLDRKQFDRALGFATRALDADRESAVAMALKGQALEGLSKKDEALRIYSQAMVKDPNNITALLRLGELSLASGDEEEAKKRFAQVASIDPDNMDARVALFRLKY